MGAGGWSNSTFSSIKNDTKQQTRSQTFNKQKVDDANDPINIVMRESRDSVEHPNSLPTIIALDETGSMGSIPDHMIKNTFGTLMQTIIDHGVPDPQIMFVGVGDHFSDKSPLQPTQFESETTLLAKAMTSIYLEGNGGGNGGESYFLPWIFASRYTSTDSFEKRGVKGFIFTIGDENIHDSIDTDFQKKIFGVSFENTITAKQALQEAERTYHVFHIGLTSYHSTAKWKDLLGERFIQLSDENAVAETIATTIAIVNGADMQSVVSKFDAKTAGVVSTALAHLSNSSVVKNTSNTGVMTL